MKGDKRDASLLSRRDRIAAPGSDYGSLSSNTPLPEVYSRVRGPDTTRPEGRQTLRNRSPSPAPATVVTAPCGEMRRIARDSATYTFPCSSTARLCGWLKRAAMPRPSRVLCCAGAPAKVVTTPCGVILRIAEPPSMTYTLPALSATMS